jgi:hypothetical protein
MGYTTSEVVITGYARMDEICRRGLGICGLNLGDSEISCLLKWSGERELSISLSAADWVRVGFVDTGLYQLVSGPALLGLVWLRPFPGGSPPIPGPNKPRVKLARGSPPRHLVLTQGDRPRPFHIVPWDIDPLVETSGPNSSSRSPLATEKATAERRRRDASIGQLFLHRDQTPDLAVLSSPLLSSAPRPLLSHLSPLWRSSDDLLRLKSSSSPATSSGPDCIFAP